MATGVILSLPHFMSGNGEIIIFGIIACVITIGVFYAWLENISKSINEGMSCLLIAIIWIPILTFCLIPIGAASNQWDMVEVGIILTFFSAPITLLIETIAIIVKKRKLKKLLSKWEDAEKKLRNMPTKEQILMDENRRLKSQIDELQDQVDELQERIDDKEL